LVVEPADTRSAPTPSVVDGLTFTTGSPPADGQSVKGDIMNKIYIGCALTVASLASFAGTAQGAGGGGTSVCSGSGKPDGYVVVGDLSTYNSAGELVSELAPVRGDQGFGWNVQGVCNPNRFVP
jgi:hypothetical protein